MIFDEKSPNANTLLQVKDLAELLGTSVSSIYRRRSLGEPLPRAIKIGGAVRWRQSDVDAWLDQHLEDH